MTTSNFYLLDEPYTNTDGTVFSNAVVVDDDGFEWLAFATVTWSEGNTKISVDLELVVDDEGNKIINPGSSN